MNFAKILIIDSLELKNHFIILKYNVIELAVMDNN